MKRSDKTEELKIITRTTIMHVICARTKLQIIAFRRLDDSMNL